MVSFAACRYMWRTDQSKAGPGGEEAGWLRATAAGHMGEGRGGGATSPPRPFVSRQRVITALHSRQSAFGGGGLPIKLHVKSCHSEEKLGSPLATKADRPGSWATLAKLAHTDHIIGRQRGALTGVSIIYTDNIC